MKERIDVWGLRWMLGRGGPKGCCSCCLKTFYAARRKNDFRQKFLSETKYAGLKYLISYTILELR